MAESFARWESDPLFSAAEVVQDSADRMESVFRMLLHDQSLLRSDSLDPKLLSGIQYHKRDLMTAIETAKWQLEDFERAVNFAALSDKSNVRQNAILKHRQFIRAIREQIIQVEKSVEDSSMADLKRNQPWASLNEQDSDGLALFLSGGDSRDDHRYGSASSIMRSFPDSAKDSDEIVEINNEEVGHLQMNGYDSKRYGFNGTVLLQNPVKERESDVAHLISKDYDLEVGESGAKCYSYESKLRGILRRFLRNSWIASKNKGSYTKRRKDGEFTDHLTDPVGQGTSSFSIGICPAEQVHGWLEDLRRIFQRSQYAILYNRVSIRLTSSVLVTLTVLGFVAFHIA